MFDRHAYRGVTTHQCNKKYANITGRPPDPAAFPKPLEPVDDRPPISVITKVLTLDRDQVRVIGCSADDGRIKAVRVNGVEVRPIVADFSRWEVTLDSIPNRPVRLEAVAEDALGNVERTPHVLTVTTDSPSPAIHPVD